MPARKPRLKLNENEILTAKTQGTPEFESEQDFFQGRSLVERGQYVEAVQQLQQSIRLDAEASHSQNLGSMPMALTQ